MSTSRRGFLKRAMLGAAALGVTRLPGIGGLGSAVAALFYFIPGFSNPWVLFVAAIVTRLLFGR